MYAFSKFFTFFKFFKMGRESGEGVRGREYVGEPGRDEGKRKKERRGVTEF